VIHHKATAFQTQDNHFSSPCAFQGVSHSSANAAFTVAQDCACWQPIHSFPRIGLLVLGIVAGVGLVTPEPRQESGSAVFAYDLWLALNGDVSFIDPETETSLDLARRHLRPLEHPMLAAAQAA
jgi:hypothetical protein